MVAILAPVYEAEFLGFSYGFRPGRSQHNALDALAFGIARRKVRWVLDADIQSFFDRISHEWLVKFVEHRIGDKRVIRLIRKWLKAGVLEDGIEIETTQGTPQGAVISPLLANIYLHYVYDLWAQQWRKRQSNGDMIVVRYADDTIVGFEHRSDAEKFLKDLHIRLAQFGLNLHPEKTRLIEFGRDAIDDRAQRGEGINSVPGPIFTVIATAPADRAALPVFVPARALRSDGREDVPSLSRIRRFRQVCPSAPRLSASQNRLRRLGRN